jgi:DNA-binding NarL/FixJ family response regulator
MPLQKRALVRYITVHSGLRPSHMHSSTTTSLRAVLLDPHPIWLDAVELVLNRVGVEVVGKTTWGREAIRLVEEREPDLLTVEIDCLPGEPGGLEVLRQARSSASRLRTVVLSGHSDTAHIDGALAAGASAYVVKTAHPDDVASAVRQTFDNSVFVPRAQTPPTLVASGEARPRGNPAGLTRRELEILKLVAEGHSNAALARMLWVTEQTVKFHLSNIYRKLRVTNRTEASRWAQVNGVLTGDRLSIV